MGEAAKQKQVFQFSCLFEVGALISSMCCKKKEEICSERLPPYVGACSGCGTTYFVHNFIC